MGTMSVYADHAQIAEEANAAVGELNAIAGFSGPVKAG
jgi:hypothetical protein